jgi:hypothetical protein
VWNAAGDQTHEIILARDELVSSLILIKGDSHTDAYRVSHTVIGTSKYACLLRNLWNPALLQGPPVRRLEIEQAQPCNLRRCGRICIRRINLTFGLRPRVMEPTDVSILSAEAS